ncbi:MAG: DMT family transporter [Anaerolineae bacterium]|nr:DMT family transporter [Anaerolineae bacterium]
MVTLIWGSTFVMVKDVVSSYPVFPFLTLRFAFATLALLPLGWRRLRTLGWRGLGAGALIGLFLFAGYAFQTVGLRYTSASKTGFITGLYVVMVPILSASLLRERPAAKAILGVGLATVGLALLSIERDLGIARGDLLVLMCAFSFALHIVTVSAFAPKADPIALTIVQVVTVTLVSGVVALVTEPTWPMPERSTWLAAGFTGILATAVAFGIQTAMQRFTTPTHTALIFTGEPVFAALFGLLWAGDVLLGRHVAGGLLIILGTLVSEIQWSNRTAMLISRFVSPHYVAVPLMLVMVLSDSIPWQQGLLWAAVTATLGVAIPLAVWARQFRHGGISDWHVSDRRERLQPVLVLTSLFAALVPLLVLIFLGGPRSLLVVYWTVLALVIINLMITVWWKVSQHVSSIAASTALIVVALGVGAAPVLLFVPLVAWARVKLGAHTVMQTVIGGVTGITVSLLISRLSGLA